MVLTHLILNGMIKVKGQLGEMAKCLSDNDKRIKDLAHLFFEELATKDKAIYNNLPDIISHLSSGANPVDEDTFQVSMKFIFKFVDKVKLAVPPQITRQLTVAFPPSRKRKPSRSSRSSASGSRARASHGNGATLPSVSPCCRSTRTMPSRSSSKVRRPLMLSLVMGLQS